MRESGEVSHAHPSPRGERDEQIMEIVLATRNKKKIEEITRITRDLSITILSLENFPNCRETVEDKDTFEGNAVKKAVEVCQCTGKPALADDSGLEVDALGGAPGVYSARYAGGTGNGSDVRNYEKLLAELKNVTNEKRGAQFVCCMALAFPDGTVKTFSGYAKGHIGMEPKGKTGFGYDPVFIPGGYEKTFAEMSGEEKDKLSHRGKALEKLADFLHIQSLL
jgi:XTP/dITP diphosphohydrolase